jgi:dsDNA-binding SOS-regulon protein
MSSVLATLKPFTGKAERWSYPAMSDIGLADYLIQSEGIAGNISREELSSWIAEARIAIINLS